METHEPRMWPMVGAAVTAVAAVLTSGLVALLGS